MKKIIYTSLFMILALPAYGQLGIGTDNPQGKVDINQKNGKNTMGLVLPKVTQVDVDSIYTTVNAAGDESNLVVVPSVTTFDNPFQTITITETDDDGVTTSQAMRSPVDEAPEGTIVYDESLGCVRYKKTSTLGDWTGCIMDKQAVEDEINYNLYGGQDFKIKKGSAGYYFSVAIGAEDNAVYTSGSGSAYRTGQGRTGNTPWTNILGQPAVDVSAGYQHGAAVLENGDLYTWGYNTNGQTCQGVTSGYTMTPKKVTIPNNENVIRVEAGYRNTLILTASGKVYTCGRNTYGLNANGLTSGTVLSNPTQITALDSQVVKDIALAPRAAGVVTQDGKVFTWGENANYRTGLGTNSGTALTPTLVPALNTTGKTFTKLAIGIGNGIAVASDNSVYVWGTRALGTTSRNTPTLVTATELPLDADETIVSVAAARHRNRPYLGSSVLLVTNKTVYAVGRNTSTGTNSGKLGIVTDDTGAAIREQNATFKEIQSHAMFSGIPPTGASIGYTHALISTGESTENPAASNLGYGSGYNNYRQLGTTANRRVFMSLKK
ncbi:RCC1 domain-containing protein [Chryseobacterium sp. CT-SW4]|uniref:RCC1 domain-containing protein n=1 Tax=Chryseobacterium sp. SW-1 TaxID=3157343 RepID=UPI003B01C2D9